MLQYEDLTLRDINYYWRKSILLFERDNIKIPCYISGIESDCEYPITLTSLLTETKVVNLRLPTFIDKVLIHHPALGYGDYKGIPFYLSTRAGQTLVKGVDNHNITILCPIDWRSILTKKLADISKKAASIIDGGNCTLPTQLSKEYSYLENLFVRRPALPYSRSCCSSEAVIRTNHNKIMCAHIMTQSVNNKYPSLRDALISLGRKSPHRLGVSISRDFALLHSNNAPRGSVALFHNIAHVGHINLLTGDVAYNTKIPYITIQSLQLIFNKVSK